MTDQALLTEMQYAFLEPVIDGGATWASLAWTPQEVLAALNKGQWELQRALQFGAVQTTIPVLAGATSIALPDDWITTVAAVWEDAASGARMPLAPADTAESDHAVPTWQDGPDTPLVYLDRDQASLTTRLAPIPAFDGLLDLLYCPRAAALDGTGLPLDLPLEMSYGAKWHALSTLLGKVGRLQDVPRSDYAAARHRLLATVGEILLKGLA